MRAAGSGKRGSQAIGKPRRRNPTFRRAQRPVFLVRPATKSRASCTGSRSGQTLAQFRGRCGDESRFESPSCPFENRRASPVCRLQNEDRSRRHRLRLWSRAQVHAPPLPGRGYGPRQTSRPPDRNSCSVREDGRNPLWQAVLGSQISRLQLAASRSSNRSRLLTCNPGPSVVPASVLCRRPDPVRFCHEGPSAVPTNNVLPAPGVDSGRDHSLEPTIHTPVLRRPAEPRRTLEAHPPRNRRQSWWKPSYLVGLHKLSAFGFRNSMTCCIHFSSSGAP